MGLRTNLKGNTRFSLASMICVLIPLWGCSFGSNVQKGIKNEAGEDVLRCSNVDGVEGVCSAAVLGVGFVDSENDYLPHVIACENGNAPPASLRAQAIAARSFLYYRMNVAGVIEDGQIEQVYTCARQPSEEHYQAVQDTSGVVLRYKRTQVAAFYVAGAEPMPPSCEGNPDSNARTERFVTYNQGKRKSHLVQSSIGFVGDSNLANRGCMSQHGANCLADQGSSTLRILKFYYGDDIELHQAAGECIDIASSCKKHLFALDDR